MKRGGSIFLAVLLGACSKGLEQEPNDHFTQATPVGTKTRLEGTIRTPEDIDVYKIEVTRAFQSLSIKLEGVKTVDFVLSVLDAERRELKKFDETSVGGDEKAFDIGLEIGAYYVVVSNKNPEADNAAARYALELTYEPGAGREREPNDRALEATRLVPGEIMRGRYYPSQNLLAEENNFQEEDWYRMDVHRDGVYLLNIDVSEVPKIDAVLEIYGPNAYKIKEVDAEGPGRPEILKGFGLRGPVHYFIRIRSKGARAFNSDIRYEILTELLPYRGVQEFEPNDQRLEATPITGESISGTIAPRGDSDWFKIQVDGESPKLLSALLSGVEGLDLVLDITDDIGTPLLSVNDRLAEQPEVLTGLGLTAGTYFLVVSEKTGAASDARRAYTLSRTLVDFPKGYEYELNNSSGSAQSVEIDTPIDGYLAPSGDVDWYVFNVYQEADIRLEVTGLLNVAFQLELFGQEGEVLGDAPNAPPGSPVSFSHRLPPGTYWARLSAAGDSENNVRDKYTFRVLAR